MARDYSGDTGVLGSPSDVMGYIRSGQNKKNQRSKGRSTSSGGNGNAAGRRVFNRTINRGKRS